MGAGANGHGPATTAISPLCHPFVRAAPARRGGAPPPAEAGPLRGPSCFWYGPAHAYATTSADGRPLLADSGSRGRRSGARWTREAPAGDAVRLAYTGTQANVSGGGLAPVDLLAVSSKTAALPGGLIVRASFLKKDVLKAWLYNPESARRKAFKGLPFFPYDPKGAVKTAFTKNYAPKAVPYLDSRNQQGTMYAVGVLRREIGGRPYELPAYSSSGLRRAARSGSSTP